MVVALVVFLVEAVAVAVVSEVLEGEVLEAEAPAEAGNHTKEQRRIEQICLEEI